MGVIGPHSPGQIGDDPHQEGQGQGAEGSQNSGVPLPSPLAVGIRWAWAPHPLWPVATHPSADRGINASCVACI